MVTPVHHDVTRMEAALASASGRFHANSGTYFNRFECQNFGEEDNYAVDKNGQVIPERNQNYYEAWPVIAVKNTTTGKITGYLDNTKLPQPKKRFDDLRDDWATLPQDGVCGFRIRIASAWFVPNGNYPKTWKSGQAQRLPSGILPASVDSPPGWPGDAGGVQRLMIFTWLPRHFYAAGRIGKGPVVVYADN